jgi:ankyrin repeat protein
METLTNQFTRGDIEEALENLPRGEEGLNETYSQAMKRIEDQKASEKHAKKVLSWVIHARRPLSGAELLHAFSVKSGTSELNRKYIPELEDLVSICAGLITIDERSDIVRLVHYTTQEYFQRTQQMWFPHAERDIATACVTYLSFDTFDEGFCLTDEQLESRLQLNPFYDYTSRNWGYHVQAAFSDVEQLLLKLFQSDAKVTATAQALLIVKGYLNYSQRVPQQVTGMHLAAYFGMDELIKFLLMHEYSPHPKDSHGQTPIVWAAKNGNAAALRLLLEEGPDINAKDNDGWTALQHAIWNTELATVRLLLEHKADIMAKDNNGWTALHRAADSGREDMVQLIIGNESIDAENMTPEMVRYKTFVKNLVKNGVVGTLHDAITSGDETTVKLLVEKGANIEMKDDWKETALDKAASYGNEAIMQILLENGADMEARNFSGRTPIHSAAAFSKNSSAGLMMLLEHGSHIKAKDEKGQTPLHLAAYFGNEAAVRLLLGMEDIDIEAKDDAGLTPLMQAAADGHEATVQLLLQQNANPESEDCKGRTAILCAADGWVHSSRTAGGCATGRAAVARVLLEQKDVKPNAQDCAGRTALICATEHEEEEALTRVLLEYNVDVNTKDGSGKTALLHAAARGDETIVRLLLEKGAYVDPCKELKEAAYNGRENVVKLLLEYVKGESEEKWLATAQLCGAVEGGDEEVVRSLLERGVDVRNAHGVTLVVSAVEKGHEKILRLLLASGADVNFSSHDTLTPLVAAAYYGSVSMMKIILESGANIVSQGAQALEFAARKGNEEVVQLLLDSGADANEGRWFTALYWAIEGTFSKQGDSEPIVRLLLERGANIAAKYGSDRMTALHIAACGHLAVIELLVEKGADKEAKDSKGLTPLHWATQRGYVEAVRLLLELGADPNNVDIGTMTRITEHRTDSKTREDYVAAIQMIREARRVKSV